MTFGRHLPLPFGRPNSARAPDARVLPRRHLNEVDKEAVGVHRPMEGVRALEVPRCMSVPEFVQPKTDGGLTLRPAASLPTNPLPIARIG